MDTLSTYQGHTLHISATHAIIVWQANEQRGYFMSEQEKKKPRRPTRYGPDADGSPQHPQLTPEMVKGFEKRQQARQAKKDREARDSQEG
jgi:hypothetical protein